MRIKTCIVDSFTTAQFKGNPAGVCLLEEDLPVATMQSIALELGLSETAFVKRLDGVHRFSIRFFSPKKEIPLCGHATLAAAKVLFRHSASRELYFINVEQVELLVTRQDEEITMSFPVYDTVPVQVPDAMMAALGLKELVWSAYSEKNKIVLLEIADSDLLAGLSPDFNALVHSYQGINGVLVTARSRNEAFDYQYRYFWPWAGTNEDPVTGGVQTFLAKYWSEKLNKEKMLAFQSSERTGQMAVELDNDKVRISSTAVIVFEGDLLLH